MEDRQEIRIVKFEEIYAEAAVRMWRASKKKAIGMDETHSFEDHVNFLKEVLVEDNNVYLALDSDTCRVVGLMVTDGEYLNQLYIHNDYQRRGIGSRLLDQAKARSSGSLRLYTFVVNQGARAFYEDRGFRIIEFGNDNEEGLADILYEWSNCA